jgi:hypothetical protein
VGEKLAMRLGTLLLAVSGTTASAQTVISQPAGPYAVGLRIIQQYDLSREFKSAVDAVTGQTVAGERARPVAAHSCTHQANRALVRSCSTASFAPARSTMRQMACGVPLMC